MNSESRDEAPTFEKVARLIAEEEGDVDWLADGLRGWIWPQERYPASARKYGHGLGMFADIVRTRWSRAKVLKELKETLPRAADTLTDLMSDWGLFGFLTDERLGPGFGLQERIVLGKLLHEIRWRCHQVSRFPELVSPDGKPKAGRNKLLALGQIDEKVVCASTWEHRPEHRGSNPLSSALILSALEADLKATIDGLRVARPRRQDPPMRGRVGLPGLTD